MRLMLILNYDRVGCVIYNMIMINDNCVGGGELNLAEIFVASVNAVFHQ